EDDLSPRGEARGRDARARIRTQIDAPDDEGLLALGYRLAWVADQDGLATVGDQDHPRAVQIHVHRDGVGEVDGRPAGARDVALVGQDADVVEPRHLEGNGLDGAVQPRPGGRRPG